MTLKAKLTAWTAGLTTKVGTTAIVTPVTNKQSTVVALAVCHAETRLLGGTALSEWSRLLAPARPIQLRYIQMARHTVLVKDLNFEKPAIM